MARRRIDEDARVEALAADPLSIAQTHALDATVFPRASLPEVLVIPKSAPLIWVARASAGGAVIGFCAAERRGARLDITHLGVDAAHRGRGLGRALLRAAVRAARARGVSEVTLQVSTGNAAAIALYESERFEVVRTIRGFYPPSYRFPDGGAAFVMHRRPV